MGQALICNRLTQEEPREKKYKRRQDPILYQSALLSGSMRLTSDYEVTDGDEIFQLMHVGQYLPCIVNKKSDNLWENIINTLEQKLNSGGPSKLSTYQDDVEITILFEKKEKIINFQERLCNPYLDLSFVYSEVDIQIIKLYEMRGETDFRNLVMVGPPQKYRWSCWKTILLYSNNQFCNKGLYERMIESDSKEIGAIIKDMDRTLSTHPYFEQAKVDFKFGQNQLLRVLNAVANSLPQLGYCQGMNFLSGLMLIVSSCDESMCYSSFLSLLLSPKHMLYFLYCPDMPFHDLLAYIIIKQVKKYFPKLYRNVKQQQIPDTFWISKLIISLFLYIMDLSNCVRVWDYIISRGSIRALPELMLAVIDKLKDRLENANFEEFACVFQGFVISNEKEQESFDKNFKIGIVIHDAASKYILTEKKICRYAGKFVQKNQKNPHIKFYELFTHFNKEDEYNKQVKDYIDQNVTMLF